MVDSMATLTHKIDSLVFDCFQKSSDIILQGRRCTLEPERSPSQAPGYKDNSDYCYQVLKDWKLNLSSPVVLDVSLLDPETKGFHLMERWKIIYKRKDDTKDGRLSAVSRRIVTLMRTLYCFVRLLPGFQLLNMCPTVPVLSFRLYNSEQPSSRNFVSESSYYDFPRIQTFRGTLYLGVRYMASNILQRILQIPPGLLNMSSDTSPIQSQEGRSQGTLRSTVPIPIPGMGQQPLQSSSEKIHSKTSFSATGGTEIRADAGSGGDGIGFNRQRDNSSLKQQYINHDQGRYRSSSVVSATTHSRSLDSRPQGLHQGLQGLNAQAVLLGQVGQGGQGGGQGQGQGQQRYMEGEQQPPQTRLEEESSGNEMNYSLSTPPKHPQRLQYNNAQQSEQVNRYNLGSGVGSYVSESGTSPGGGTPFYLTAAAGTAPSGSGTTQKEGSNVGRGEARARSGSAFSRLTEAEGDGVSGSGVPGVSPPYLEFSTHLQSTSPDVGRSYGALNSMERSQGAITLYQTPGHRGPVRGETDRHMDKLQQNQLVPQYHMKSNMHSLTPEGFTISVNLHVVLPRSPFDTAPTPTQYTDSYNTAASELVVRPRSSSHSQSQSQYMRGSYADIAKGHMQGHERLLEGGRADEVLSRRNSTAFIEEGEDAYDREEDNDEEDEEEDDEEDEDEEEDMPFAWVDHSMIATQTFEKKSKGESAGDGQGAGSADREKDVSWLEGKAEGSSPSFSQKGAGYSIGMPPALVSFPDAHWYDSGSAAVVSAVFNQLNEYKEFRSTFPS